VCAADGGLFAVLGADCDGGLSGALAVTVDQPNIPPLQRARDGQVKRDGGFAHPAFCVSDGDNHDVPLPLISS
jgi:hypothetical protein